MFKRMRLTLFASPLCATSVETTRHKANQLFVSLLLTASCALALPVAGRAQSFTTVHTFTGGADGGAPYAGLTQAYDGNLYGTTTSGGSSGNGTIFRLVPNGALTTLHSFAGVATVKSGVTAANERSRHSIASQAAPTADVPEACARPVTANSMARPYLAV
jgi:uncharacterized repeat protein (TIGR03803 family)